MKISPVSFQGLWNGPVAHKKIGEHKVYGSPVYVDTFEYRPFIGESDEKIAEALKKGTKSIYELHDDRVQDPYGPEAYYITEVKLGERLNVTADEYKEMTKMQTKFYDSDDLDIEYRKLNKNQLDSLMKSIK